MQKRKTSSGPRQMDCSDGAKMLIDQMKEHPEEFRGYASKFRDTLEAAQRTIHQPTTASAAYQMSTRDARAIMEAAETHLFEVWLAEDVLTKMMAPKEEPMQYREAMRLGASGSLGLGIRPTGKSVLQGAVLNTTVTASQYEQEYQRMLMKRDQEAIAPQEREYLNRPTKLFKKYT